MNEPTIQYVEDFARHYFVTALWSETDNSEPSGGEPLDKNYDLDDIHSGSLIDQTKDCERFVHSNWSILKDLPAEQAGHDFWLTRNGHGAGFWDGDYEEEVGKRLTHASEQFGNVDVTLGDDGKIYFE